MIERAFAVEQAFRDLEQESAPIQALLRPVLMRALQEPSLMRQLASTALSQHLFVVGRLLTSLPTEGIGPPIPPLKTFEHLTIGEDVEDAEEAYDYLRSLDAPIRARVEGSLTRVLHSHAMRSGEGTINLLAVARLLAIAFSNMPTVAHVLDGGTLEPFLPQRASKPPRIEATQRKSPANASPQLASFLGAFVEIISIVNESNDERRAGHMFVTIGRVAEISPAHVLLETLRGHDSSSTRTQKVLLGMASVVVLRMLSADDS
ncbi:MAG TPA: hypothetical protein VGI10_06650 [Polyangiaceae bacterium]